MMNLGGPENGTKVEPFLSRLFSDPDIIPLGRFQKQLGPFIASRRSPGIVKQYEEIGGGSPIRKWTEKQSTEMTRVLDDISPSTGPHKSYIAFRYADPLTDEALDEMAADGVERVVAFSQYPHWSCTTAGSSLNELWRRCAAKNLEFKWSVIDRWGMDTRYIKAIQGCILDGLSQFPVEERDSVMIVFSSHSLPQKVVDKGDAYPMEVAGTVQSVMNGLKLENSFIHAWQSKVGFLPWIIPKTQDILSGLGKQGTKNVLVVPVGFTSDHVETLYELDIEYREVAEKAGIQKYIRARSLNDDPDFIQALAHLVKDHLESGRSSSPQYTRKCAHCSNPECRKIPNAFNQ